MVQQQTKVHYLSRIATVYLYLYQSHYNTSLKRKTSDIFGNHTNLIMSNISSHKSIMQQQNFLELVNIVTPICGQIDRP